MTGSTKQKTLIFLGLVVIIMVFIAAGLPQLKLQPGMPAPRVENGAVVITPVEALPAVTVTLSEFAKTILALLLAGITIFVIYRAARGLDWRHPGLILRPIMISVSIAGIVLFLVMLLAIDPPRVTPMNEPNPTVKPVITSPLGPVPPLLLWLTGLGLLALCVGTSVWIFQSMPRRPAAIGRVGLAAEKAVRAIQTGGDLKAVIVQCYRQMSLALEQDQELERQEWMTTREFENLLESAGMPFEPIHQLTQLFEAVRYGDWQPNALDEQKATQCLQAIVLHSQSAKKTA